MSKPLETETGINFFDLLINSGAIKQDRKLGGITKTPTKNYPLNVSVSPAQSLVFTGTPEVIRDGLWGYGLEAPDKKRFLGFFTLPYFPRSLSLCTALGKEAMGRDQYILYRPISSIPLGLYSDLKQPELLQVLLGSITQMHSSADEYPSSQVMSVEAIKQSWKLWLEHGTRLDRLPTKVGEPITALMSRL